MTSFAVSEQWGQGEGGVVCLLHHQPWRAQAVLHNDFALLDGRAVGDHLFPWFLEGRAGSDLGSAADQGRPAPLLLGMEGTCDEGIQSHLLPWGWGAPALYGMGEAGCCRRLRSSETSGESWSSGACLPVSLALVSGMQVFRGGPQMPVSRACLGGTFSVF